MVLGSPPVLHALGEVGLLAYSVKSEAWKDASANREAEQVVKNCRVYTVTGLG